jgi:phosphoenolpyruvate synthase/pyruvate phosphate dikinase
MPGLKLRRPGTAGQGHSSTNRADERQVGGVLQHGAVVAREYGKPCVTGIENAASILQDGQWVEMDGASGIVRLVQDTVLQGAAD